ncbi:RUS family member 1 isoform X3 [Erythrolamprus reginae]|uniref:RUS family member 1 isoform X3 n=1 Tax=Erythrolamprus reginae TaxID=121349 RepID=UPI00396CFBED
MTDLEIQTLCTESYGSRSARRYQALPDGKLSSVADASEARHFPSLHHIFMSIFLPQGYPESVSTDYLAYQFWDTIQAFASSITGTLATQAVLKGVGVGDETSTVAAATVTWILKDGTGMLGRIVFAWSKGSKLDCDAKQWRLFADVLNDVAIFMEIVAPAFPACFTLIVCTSGFFKETVVNLAGLLFSLFLIPLVVDNLLLTYALYALFTVLHLYANYQAVRAVCMETLNGARLHQVFQHYLKWEEVPGPAVINPQEPLLLGFRQQLKITLGAPLYKVTTSVADFQKALEGNASNYLIFFNRTAGLISILLHRQAGSVDVIKAYTHALLLEALTYQDMGTCVLERGSLLSLQRQLYKESSEEDPRIHSEMHQFLDRIFPKFLAGLTAAGWVTDRNLLGPEEWRMEWLSAEKKML